MKIGALILALATIVDRSIAQDYDYQDGYQDYQDYADGYEQDSLYQDYAMKQQEKGDGKGGG